MLFWHLGVTTAVVYFFLGHRSIDYRVVMLGAVLPDLIDKPIGRILFEEQFENGRIFAHTLLYSTSLLLAIQLFTRGKKARRWFILPIASLIHLALDGMWNEPVTLFWPLFTTQFPRDVVDNYWLELLRTPLEHPIEIVKELVGIGLLLYLASAHRLDDPARRGEFLRTGLLWDRPAHRERQERQGREAP